MSRFSRGRAASPYDDNVFATATETSFKDLLHSTPQRLNLDPPQALPLHYDQHPSPWRREQEENTLGSAEMSIELGRGLKRSQQDFADMSSNAVFSFDNTPPMASRGNQKSAEVGLRKQASVRRAAESTRANDALKRSTNRSVSDTFVQRNSENEPIQTTATFSLRGSRFAGVRQVSSQYNVPKRYTMDGGFDDAHTTPRRAAAANATVQSATYTAGQSFVLPDLANITELVSGRNDGTPLIQRTAASRTRFVSGTHHAVNTMPVPQDEQAIFASLQMLSDRVAQLELEKSEAQKHVEEYEHEVIELRAQLGAHRSDSGLGSEDGDTAPAAGVDKARLHAKVKAVEERLHRTERKISVSEITVTRITKERDHLVQQLASSYVANEDLEKENEALRNDADQLLAENEQFKLKLRELQTANSNLLAELERLRTARTSETSAMGRGARQRSRSNTRHENIADGLTINTTVRSKQSTQHNMDQRRHRSTSHLNEEVKQDLASRIQDEVRKQKEATLSGPRNIQSHATRTRTRSQSRSRSQRQDRRQGDDSSDELEHARGAKETTIHSRKDHETESKSQTQQSSKYVKKFEEDLTQLSDLDPVDVANLRRKLEDEMRARHSRKYSGTQEEANFTSGSITQQSVMRKSSMKDVTADVNENTAQLEITKTVRVQSPHTIDEISHSGHDTTGEISSLSNTSRRRRRHSTASEGLTSAFILPDITVAVNQGAVPVPVTDRSTYNPDATNVTVRPSQTPILALTTVIRHLEEEIAQLKAKREAENRAYTAHDPGMARRARLACLGRIEALTKEIEKRSDQVYALYDVLEAHKGDLSQGKTAPNVGHAGKAYDVDDTESELAFEGFSETDEEQSREVRI